ncbi:MAG: LmbE family protein [Acidimicrobiaceae bacterium]|nr:LmbE family protein [Acidimicrobiaceae bacterium]
MRVLAVGAHPVDIELGCGGALLAHRDRGDEIHLLVMTGGESSHGETKRRGEQELSAARLGAVLHWGGFDDGAVPTGREAIAAVEAVLVSAGCEVVYSHAAGDTHQDHRATADATLAAARRTRQVLAYESPSTVHFDPMVFVDLEGRVGSKLELLGAHRSQIETSEFVDLSAVAAQARHRGSQARMNHAEGFQTHRFVWELAPAPSLQVDLDAPFGARAVLARHGIGPVVRTEGSLDEA